MVLREGADPSLVSSSEESRVKHVPDDRRDFEDTLDSFRGRVCVRHWPEGEAVLDVLGGSLHGVNNDSITPRRKRLQDNVIVRSEGISVLALTSLESFFLRGIRGGNGGGRHSCGGRRWWQAGDNVDEDWRLQ